MDQDAAHSRTTTQDREAIEVVALSAQGDTVTDPNVKNVASHPKPDGSGKRRFRDVAWIVIAAGIIGAVCKSSAVFVVVAVIAVALYAIGGPPRR